MIKVINLKNSFSQFYISFMPPIAFKLLFVQNFHHSNFQTVIKKIGIFVFFFFWEYEGRDNLVAIFNNVSRQLFFERGTSIQSYISTCFTYILSVKIRKNDTFNPFIIGYKRFSSYIIDITTFSLRVLRKSTLLAPPLTNMLKFIITL